MSVAKRTLYGHCHTFLGIAKRGEKKFNPYLSPSFRCLCAGNTWLKQSQLCCQCLLKVSSKDMWIYRVSAERTILTSIDVTLLLTLNTFRLIFSTLIKCFIFDFQQLSHFWPMFPFYTPWEHQKAFGFQGV